MRHKLEYVFQSNVYECAVCRTWTTTGGFDALYAKRCPGPKKEPLMPSKTHRQAYLLADHLNSIGDISGLEAMSLYRITSVTKVISVLRSRYGWEIKSKFRYDHTGKRYKRYFLAR